MSNLSESAAVIIQAIESEIEKRRTLVHQMVGQLYPSIICGEIVDLQTFRTQIQDFVAKYQKSHPEK